MSQDEWNVVLEDYRRELELEGFRPRTIGGRTWVAGKFVLWCREREVLSPRGLTPAILYAYRRYRLEHLNARGHRDGPLTVNLHLEGLRDLVGRLSRKG